ncbi:MAG TPA: hypothetical protein VFX15_08705 [Actinomycetes bacterium]|nr:hypothetical protein [Actinomycetes bacterium]
MTDEEQQAMWRSRAADEKARVKQLGDAIGFGNMISLARALWAEMLTPSLGAEAAKHHAETWGCDCEKSK